MHVCFLSTVIFYRIKKIFLMKKLLLSKITLNTTTISITPSTNCALYLMIGTLWMHNLDAN